MKKSFFYITFIIFMSHAIVLGEEISKSFSGLDNNVIIDNEVFVDKIKAIILSQPEFSEATAFKNQNNADRNYASRLRFPTLGLQVINDRTMSREIETNALRKTRDDTFDGVISIDQTIYKGNEIRSKIKSANLKIKNASIKLNQTASLLIITATDIYVNAAITDLLASHSEGLVKDFEKYREIAKKRFNAGVVENTEMAIINIRLSEIETKNALLQARKIESASVYEAFFNEKYNNNGLPEIELINFSPESSINSNVNNYDERISKNEIEITKANLEITKSQYRPQLGFSARYTRYDIDAENIDNDLRGGFYIKFPFFSFGRGSAEVASARSKIDQARSQLDKTRRDVKYTKASNYGSSLGSLQARNKLLESFNNVKLQRETFLYRMESSSFSISTVLEAAIRELAIYEQLILNEKELLMSDLKTSHMNERLLQRFFIVL
jgi:outer membrane protein TolC